MTYLPVYQHRQDVLDALKDHQIIVVESPTGSGKTTQLPIILHQAGYDSQLSIGITQPRRIATLSVCDFIKDQIGDEGSYVGYKMRFNDTTTSNTRIKVMTDGILLMELKADPLLNQYSVMLIDEAHERSLNIDFILGMLKQVLQYRPDFRVIVSSATINTKKFSDFFDHAPIISINSKMFPVKVIYRPLAKQGMEYRNFQIVSIVAETVKQGPGDILIFLPGEFDIKNCVDALCSWDKEMKLVIYPLYGRLSKEEQESVFTPTPEGHTKIVVATNIAETSITIDGITTVIDLGIAKVNFYNQKDFTSSLVPLPTCKSSCEQRTGRAGRTRPGVCYRLYTKQSYEARSTYGTEEILRTDLSEVVLRMSDLGLYDYEHFPFLTKPKQEAINSAEKTLRFIGAIDEDRHLTTVGEMMVKFPLLPRHARVVVEAIVRFPSVLEEVIIAIAFLSTKSPFILPPGRENEARAAQKHFNNDKYGDFISYLTIYREYESQESKVDKMTFCKEYFMDIQSMQEVVHIAEQLEDIVGEMDIPVTKGGSVHDYLCCIASGLRQYICIKEHGYIYDSLTASTIFIHPGSAYLKRLPQYLVAGELVETSRLYARSVSPLKEAWLDDIMPGLKDRLVHLGMQKAKEEPEKEEDYQDDRKEQRRSGKAERFDSVTIYGRTYRTEKKKKGRDTVLIPYEDLAYLKDKDKNAGKQFKNMPCKVLFMGKYLEEGSKFPASLGTGGKIGRIKTDPYLFKGQFQPRQP
ncbi:MAG: ATP-dependent RNA helicase [Spirochaetia bacterium]|jgi:RNA helicase HrpA|nr:ATP-dependent RNA helicase [Spirochaetia bacterium]